MTSFRVHPAVISAALFTGLAATATIGAWGLLTNLISPPTGLFDRMLSNTSAAICVAIAAALLGLLTARRWLQISAGAVIVGFALHSLLVHSSLNRVLFMPWLANYEAVLYTPMVALFMLLGTMLMLNPRGIVQRLWVRTLALVVIIASSIILVAHFDSRGFMIFGPHPDITGVAGILLLLIGIAFLLASHRQAPPIRMPNRTASTLGGLAVFITCSTWFYMGQSHLQLIQTAADNGLQRVAKARIQMAHVNVQLLERMVERWRVADDRLAIDMQQSDVQAYMRDIPHILSISLLDAQAQPLWRFDRDDSFALAAEVLRDAEVQQWLAQQPQQTQYLIPPLRFAKRDLPAVALLLVPVNRVSSQPGYLLTTLNLNRMMNPDTRVSDDEIKIYTQLGSGFVRSFDEGKPSHGNEVVLASTLLEIPHGPNLTLTATLHSFADLNRAAGMRSVIVALGLLFSMAFLLMFQQNRLMREQQLSLGLSEQRYRSLFDNNPDPAFSLDTNGCLSQVNDAFCKLLQLPRERLLGMHYRKLIPSSQHPSVAALFEQVLAGHSQRYEVTAIAAHGQEIDLDLTNLPIKINEHILGTFGVAKDITQTKKDAEQRLLLSRGIDSGVNGIVIADANVIGFPVVYVNKVFQQITGYSYHEIVGKSCALLQGPQTDPFTVTEIAQALREKRDFRTQILNYRKDGSSFWNELYLSPVRDDQGDVTHFLGVQHDVSEQVADKEQLAYQASHDALTGLANRFSLEQHLQRLVQRQQQGHASGTLAVLFIDLDGFKPVNDSLGLKVGDTILQQAAKRLQQLIQAPHFISRFSGDEFVAVISEIEDTSTVTSLVQQLMDVIDEPYHVEGHNIYISASIGVTYYTRKIKQPLELIQQADIAMSQAKLQGRNHFQIYQAANNDNYQANVILRSEFQQAIDDDALQLHYQPIIDLHSGRVVTVEALMRWITPDGRFISPGEFIPLAESTGQIIPAGRWALRKACTDVHEMQQFGAIRVAVNLSALQFHRADFFDQVQQILEETGTPADLLELELTESILMENSNHTIEVLQRFKEVGIRVAIDDFGTGFSGLSYLKKLPVSKLKIDRIFVQDIDQSASDQAITAGVINMATQVDMEVIAEGVETLAQITMLKQLGCGYIQGFYYAKPMPLEELKVYLAQHA
ncbi:EAL domain-containing protein [Pseudidiomarina sp. PP-1MA]|uniref:EAL domain-containing protein n=1 Tax=Pseudidiomarina sp. PP-1MA TaxID=3237706 RepID=A0AB39X790_9GAMM